MIADLYRLNKDEISYIYHQFAKYFFEDDLYCLVFPDERIRKRVLPSFFKYYLQAIAPSCHFLADSKALRCVMVVYDSTKEHALSYVLRLVWLHVKLLFLLLRIRSWKTCKHVIACRDMFTSRWVSDFVCEESYHLDLLYTQEEYRCLGLAKQLIEALHQDAMKRDVPITLETHHKENLGFYEHVGFVLMSQITHPSYDICQYCFISKSKEENL